MDKQELSDHLADEHGVWLTRHEFAVASMGTLEAAHAEAHAALEVPS